MKRYSENERFNGLFIYIHALKRSTRISLLNSCGKVIVPQDVELDSQLDELFLRGKLNGAKVSFINETQLKEIVPCANSSTGRALWSPNTSVINPLEIMKKLREDIEIKGVKIFYSVQNWVLN